MSTTVDERVVSMQFDNKHFEENVKTSMSTLEKLKQALHLKGATRGLQEVDAAAKRCDLSSIGASADKVGLRFSAMYTMADQAFRNIYNSAERYAKNIISAFTIDPVKTGFQEYETQINSIQTVLSNTKSKGTTLDDVNKALDELNLYADKTIYNFTEMTRNIGTFTAAGIDLQTSVDSIQGIANLAAISGSTSQQASTAMYQLSQALASGTVKLMDWNSVVNAGMGGQVFQDALKETSKALGTGAEAAIKAEGSFRDSLHTGWLTSEVLTETLKKFTSSGANERVAEYTGLSKEAVEATLKSAEAQYGEAEAIDKASEALSKKSGKSKDEIKSVLQFAKDAEDAATKVKTFSQLMDTLKESVQSGWTQTWEILIGDFGEAKELFTSISDFLGGIIGKMSDARNKVLESALGKGFGKLAKGLDSLTKPAKAIGDTVKAVGDLGEVVNEVILGKFGNGQKRIDALTDAGKNYYRIQNKVNETLGNTFRYSEEQIAAQDKLLGVQGESIDKTEEQKEATINLGDEEKKRLKSLAMMTEAELKAKGYTDEQIEALKELGVQAEKLGMPVDEFIDNLDKIDGRWLIIDSFKNAGKGLVGVFKALGEAWKNVFDPPSLDERAEGLFNIISAVHKFSEKLVMNDETSENLRRTFEGLFAAIDIVGTLLAGPIKIAFKVLTALLDIFDVDILELTAGIGDAIVGFRDWLDSILDFKKILEPIAPFLQSAGEAIKNWFSGIDFGSIAGNIGNFFKDLIDGVKLWIDGLKETDNVPEYIIGGLVDGLKNGVGPVGQAIWDIGVAIINKIKEVLGIHSPSKVFIAIGGFIIAGLVSGLQNGTGEVWDTLRNLFGGLTDIVKGIDLGSIFAMFLSGGVVVGINNFATAFKNLTAPLEGVNDVLGSFSNLIDKNVKPIGKVIKNSAKVVKSFSKVLGSFSMAIKAEALKSIALAILMLVGAIAVLTFLDTTKMWIAVGAIASVIVLLGILAGVVGKLGDAKTFASFGVLMLGLMGLFATLAILIKVLEGLDPASVEKIIYGVAGILAVIVTIFVGIGLLNKYSQIARSDKLGVAFIKIAGAFLMMAITIKILEAINPDKALPILVSAAGIIVAFAVIMFALGLFNKFARGAGDIDKLGSTLLKIAGAIAIMGLVAVLLGFIDQNVLIKGGIAIAALGGMIALLIWATNLAGGPDKIEHIGKALMSIAGAIAILGLLAVLLGFIEPAIFWRGYACIFALGAIVVGLMTAIRLAGGPEKVKNIGVALLGIAGAISILGLMAVILGLVDPVIFWRGYACMVALGGLITGLIAATKLAKSWYSSSTLKAIIAMTVAIGVMAAAVGILGLLDPVKIAIATGCMFAVMGMFAVMMLASSKAGGALSSIIAMTVAIAVMAGALALLAVMNPEDSIGNALSLAILMGTMSVVLLLLSKISISVGKALKGVLMLSAMAAPLYLFALVLGSMSDVGNAEANMMTLAKMVAIMGLMLIPLSLIGLLGVSALAGVLLLTAMAIPLLAFIGVLSLMTNIKNAAENATVLTDLATRLTLLLLPLTLVGLLAPGAIIGVVALTAMAVPLLAFVGILALMQGIEDADSNAKILGKLITTLAGVILLIAPLGPLALIAVAAVAGLEALMIATAALATIMAGLSKIPGFKEFLDTGIDMVIRLAEGVGEIVGAFITGFTNSIKDSLPALGLCLSQFMKNVRFFIIGAQMVNDKVLTGVGILSGAVIALTAANLISSIGSFLSFGSSFADLGTELSRFMLNAMPFITMSSLLKPEMVNSVKNLAETILILTASDILDGIFSFLTGGSSLADFGAELASFGPSLKTFAESVSGLDEHSLTAMDTAATAAEKLANMANSMPKTGGLLGGIFGESNPADFGRKMAAFGQSLVTYGESVAGLTQDKIDAINISTEAAQGLSDLANSMPKGDSLLGMITGSPTDIQTFGSQLEAFGGSIVTYAESVTDLNESKVTAIGTSIDATKKLVDLANTLPEGNGFFDIFGGGQTTIEQFGTQLASFGTALSSFSTSVSGIDTGKITAAATASEKLGSMAVSIANAGNVDLVDFGYQLDQFGGHVKTYFTNIDLIPAGSVTNSANAVSAIAKFSSGFDPEKAKAAASAGWTLVAMAKGMATVPAGSTAGFVASIKALGELNISSFLNAFKEGYDSIKQAGQSMVTAINEGVNSKLIFVRDAGQDVADRLAKGITSSTKTAKSAVSTLVDECADKISDKKSAFAESGKDLVRGLVSGVGDYEFLATTKARSIANSFIRAFEKAMGIESPSKVFYGEGEYTILGFVNALADNASKVYNSGSDMGGSAIDGIRDAITKISTMTVDDMDISPTIRPVIDMSDVQAGASTINSMFGSGTLSVNARNVGAISAAMSNRQNGNSNDDIVSSINALRKDISDMPRNTYSINGITYDDGSNIADAMKTIVRAARVERRI